VKLRVLLPAHVLLETEVRRIVAEAPEGAFGLLPGHVDYAAPLVPGVLVYEDADGREAFLGVDEGLLVKRGPEVTVSVRDAVRGDEPEELQELVEARFLALDEHEKRARTALARLEAGFYRRVLEQQRHEE